MSDDINILDLDISKSTFETPKDEPEVRKSKKRSTSSPISPILLQYSHSTKKSRAKAVSESSITEELDMQSSSLDEGTGDEATQYVSLPMPMHPGDISKIAFELKPVMLPEVKFIIKDEFQAMINEAVRNINDTIKAKIASLKAENSSPRAENNDLKSKVVSLEKRVADMERVADAQEQYSRRNCLRISGIAETVNEKTDDIVLAIAEDLNVPLTPADIDRSHRVGKQSRGVRKIIVKFSTYRARQQLFF